MILVEDNETVVKYVRAQTYTPKKPNQTKKRNRKSIVVPQNQNATNADNIVLPECRVIVHKMTKEEISKKINELRAQSKIVGHLAVPCTQQQQQLLCGNAYDFSWIKRNYTIQIVFGTTKLFVASSVLRIMLLDYFNKNKKNRGDAISLKLPSLNAVEQNGKMPLTVQQHQPRGQEYDLSWIEQNDTIKITFGTTKLFIASSTLRIMLLDYLNKNNKGCCNAIPPNRVSKLVVFITHSHKHNHFGIYTQKQQFNVYNFFVKRIWPLQII